MTMLWMEGFDKYGGTSALLTDGIWAAIDQAALSTTQKRTGSYSLAVGPGSSADAAARRTLPSAKTRVGVGMALFIPALPSANNVLFPIIFRDAANVANVSVVVQSTGVIEVFRGLGGFGGVSLGATTEQLTANAFHHVEVWVTLSNTVGRVDVYIDNINRLSLTNQDTVATANVECSQIAIWKTSGYANTYYVDDVFCADSAGTYNNDQVSDCRVGMLLPNADTAEADWAKSTGTDGYALIDNVPPNDAQYISAAAATDLSRFEMGTVDAAATSIKAVALYSRAWKSDAGDGQIQAGIRSVATVASGTDRPVTTVATYYSDIFETDPNTSTPFTPVTLEAAQPQITRTV